MPTSICADPKTDMETLSRMTGKDFSGPVPEIKIPEPAAKPPTNAPTAETTQSAEPSSSKRKKRSSRKSSAAAEEGVVILGNVDAFNGA